MKLNGIKQYRNILYRQIHPYHNIYLVQLTLGISKCSVKLSKCRLNSSTRCLWVMAAFWRILSFCIFSCCFWNAIWALVSCRTSLLPAELFDASAELFSFSLRSFSSLSFFFFLKEIRIDLRYWLYIVKRANLIHFRACNSLLKLTKIRLLIKIDVFFFLLLYLKK